MFYVTGIDITNDKQMFNFLKNHFEYWTLNPWNRMQSIANNVKLYNLDLSGDWCVAYSFLNSDEYDTIGWMIHDWERQNPGYDVAFNGRSGGYLVLTEKGMNTNILPDEIAESVDYEEYKRYCKDYYGSVKENRSVLVEYTKLVQSFDRLCDELRDYCDMLSKQTFEVMEMQRAVEEFNNTYAEDLDYLEFQYLKCDEQGIVDVSEICQLNCLYEAFLRTANRKEFGYTIEQVPGWGIRYKKI